MEHENNYASKGQSNLNTVLGAIGTAGATGILGNLGGIFGNRDSNEHYINRYELAMQQELTAKDSKIALLESNIYTDQKIADVYEKLNSKIGCVEGQISQQAVYNATLNGTVSCLTAQITALQSLTKTIVPIDNVCPAPMPKYNSFTTPPTT